ncbi:MAG: hypothetical protein KBC84_01130 [Proteobacteria bacterium]|nr:hypothetical protein [Pseudomonadota bacterium]
MSKIVSSIFYFAVLSTYTSSISLADSLYETFGFETTSYKSSNHQAYLEKYQQTSSSISQNTLYGPIQKIYLDEIARELIRSKRNKQSHTDFNEIKDFVEIEQEKQSFNQTKQDVRDYLNPENSKAKEAPLAKRDVPSKVLLSIYNKFLAPSTANADMERRHFTHEEMLEVLNKKHEYQKNRIVGF